MKTKHSKTSSSLRSTLLIAPLLIAANSANAGGTIKISENSSISLGAGMRTQAVIAEDAAPDGGSSFDVDLASMRFYVSGQVNDTIKFTFNTVRWDNEIDVLDAIAQFEFSDYFNVWAGLMLTPADRIEMNGPYYGLSWNQYTQPLYASDQDAPGDGVPGAAGSVGRDTGVTVWGAAGKFQYAVGLFDGIEGGPNTSDSPLIAGRFAYNFLNKEDNPGYYTSSTYHGGLGNIFTLGLSFQAQSDGVGSAEQSGDFSGVTLDLLSETVLANKNVLTIEAEYKSFDSDFTGTPSANPIAGCDFCLFDGTSTFATAAYLFKGDGYGDFQPYVRFVSNDPSEGESSDLTEIGLNYVIKGHNARFNINYGNGDANITGYQGSDAGVLSIGFQLQI
ncbi:MAG: hypothetical protein ACJASL_000638 [Paraglaciecola sp.]|jgi:hypothetical protein